MVGRFTEVGRCRTGNSTVWAAHFAAGSDAFEIEAFFNFTDADGVLSKIRRGTALSSHCTADRFSAHDRRLLEAVRIVPPATVAASG